MGNIAHKAPPPVRVIVHGLTDAGKTAALWKLPHVMEHGGARHYPETPFDLELSFDDMTLQMLEWNNRAMSSLHTFNGAGAVVFVVDSSREELLPAARLELHHVLSQPELTQVPVVILATKQDLPEALGTADVAHRLGLFSITQSRWHMVAAMTPAGIGLAEAVDWLRKTLAPRRQFEYSATTAEFGTI